MAQRPTNELPRKLGLFSLTNIVIANMIGVGIFTTSGLLMGDLKNPLLMLLLWAVGGIIALCGALSYGELGAAIPRAGGEYAFLTKLYHPLMGFLSGWISFISAFVMLGPRVYYAMARDGHFFKFAAHIHPKTKVPSKALLLQSLIAIIYVGSGSFDQILTYMGFSLGIFPIFAVIGVFRLRYSRESVLKLPGFPLVQMIYIIFGMAVLLLAFLERPVESSIAIMTVLAGIPAYYLFKRQN